MSRDDYSQENRIAGVTSRQWAGFYLEQLSGREALGEPFCYEAILYTRLSAGAVPALTGKAIGLHVSSGKDRKRYIHGVVTAVDVVADEIKSGVTVHARIEPALALLKLSSQFRVFQNKPVPDVVCDVLRAGGVSSLEVKLQRVYRPHPFLMQYQESDFDFISRLLAKEGIYYFFRHGADQHTLVLTDSDLMHPESQTGRFSWRSSAGKESGVITCWKACYRMQSSGVDVKGVDPVHSRCKQASATVAGAVGTASQLLVTGETEYETMSRIAQNQAGYRAFQQQVFTGVTDDPGLVCGERITFTDHPCDSGAYYLTALELKVSSNIGHQAVRVESTFTAQKKNVPFRLPVRAGTPAVPGLLRARVVGPSSEVVHTDHEGRVKVLFLWDDAGKEDGSNACWLRVAQPWTGNGLGAQFIPRVGSEVMVGFWMGDPDDPVITGMVCSGPNLPPFPLPAGKAVSGFVTRSFSGEKESGHRLSFDDTKGKEVFLLHSPGDMMMDAGHDFSTVVENKNTLTTGGDHIVEVKKGNYSVEIRSGNGEFSTKGNMITKIRSGNYQLTVEGGECVIRANRTCELSSPAGITLKVGNSELSLTPEGISLSGTQVNIKGAARLSLKGATVNVEGQAMATLKGAAVSVEGQGTATVKGVAVSVQGSATAQVKGAITLIG
ncbi:hypothetical protein DK526_23695 [Salmonella enterica]|uniref:Type VI secretion system tip protein VgrG n=1 Tax=Salmonella enterica TaxID=28901 RepID=A0A5U6SY01_SALER|nr:hypothetical protein [Salmonella enterica]EBR0846201.1 type VI secretion system tip protein VgrG [Salmonella enterica]